MSEVVLYRKYRPHNFEEVLGQDHVVTVLKNAVKLNRVSHAYLFSGPAGTGKTSVARILARSVGCEDMDLSEIDAASSRGIDEIRALRDAVRLVPFQSPYKVYVVDEVHMLTKEAFNALLKTLEEPPKHAIFILATTELNKVPETIISRCQHFVFRKVPESIIRSSILEIAKKEGFKLDDEAAGLIALFADGSFRDSQSMLDQIFSLVGEKVITGVKVREFLAAPAKNLVDNLISSIFEKNIEKGLAIIDEAVKQGIEIKLFLKFILRNVRLVLMLQMAPDMEKELETFFSKDEFQFLKKHVNVFSNKELGNILSVLLDAYDTRTIGYLPQLPLELALMKMVSENGVKK
ncbi:MAG: DNA polymerase III, subunit gamma and tau [Candidatus Tagabacteria bacterium CG11_big_fil_rev_8_21_14_0_20_41_11]|nr:MAG: DNA polymerase III, subunit gamma and tau [Candidatus Tagabacteria bacterium CG11_big_fil_rev_8_21_14_0_20_41_11]